MDEAYKKSTIKNLVNVFYWMRELEEDAKHGVFVLSPSTFITTWLHDLIITKMAYGNKDLDWAEIYKEAKAQADANWEKEHAENND